MSFSEYKQAEQFCTGMELYSWNYVFAVTKISIQQTHDCYMSNKNKWSVRRT